MTKMDDILLAAENSEGKPQRRPLFKRRRGGTVLTREQVKAIKLGRKKLRREMKERGIKSREEFDLMAASLGLYFDKCRWLLFWRWLSFGNGLAALAGTAAALGGAVFLYSTVTQMRGHFTINMSDGLFREGFVLSETEDFARPTTHLFCEPAVDVPCISISHIPQDIDDYEGQHNENYFAYTFFLRNEGESTVDYVWSIDLNSESRELANACWVMVFEDGEMLFYAAPDENGGVEALPAFGDDSRGYINPSLMTYSRDAQTQYRKIAEKGNLTYYRAVPISFISDKTVAVGGQNEVVPMDVHKYTVVIWLEGDDPDCTDEMIGGHVGMEVNMCLVGEEGETTRGDGAWEGNWDAFWDNLVFWQG